ncbi:MAG: response regulator [Chthoniobacteraceae bacterium]
MANKPRILILDDESDILEIYQEILARLPSLPEIVTTDSGAQAVALIESQTFNLMLLDLRMPQMDGFQVLAIARRKFPSLRVVVMTGSDDEQFRARAYAMGIDLYIEKPKTGKEIINFVDAIESLLEREDQGGFRGVQSKTLIDLIQLECLTQSSAILKITTATHDGRIWVQRGEIIDAATGDFSGKDALFEMLRWKSGNFEILPHDIPRPRTIFTNYESLLMETAQLLDESAVAADHVDPEATGLAAFARHKGVQFAVAVETADPGTFDHWGSENPDQISALIRCTAADLRELGDVLEAGQLEEVEALGPQRHIAILVGDEECLGVGFTRSAVLPHIRETMKQIEAKWVS